MLKKIIFTLSITCSLPILPTLYAYEVPKVTLAKEFKPAIILFSAKSIVENDAKKYKLTWKTKNATHVQMTFLGNMKLSGSVIITEKEYLRGPITLTATSIENNFSDSKTINQFSKSAQEAPIIIKHETQERLQQVYTTPLPYGRRVDPRRLRRY